MAFLDAHGLGAGDVDVDARRRRPLQRDLRAAPRRRRRRAAPPAARPAAAQRARRPARGARAAAPRRPRARARPCSRCATTPPSSARRSTSWSASRATSSPSAVPAALDTLEDRRRIGEELVDALVEIHAVDWRDAGLEGFGKPTGYLERQLRRFLGLWEHNRTRDIPAVESVGEWLKAQHARVGPATVVHGDYRLGNTMFAPDAPARLVAIFDWEMATIGDPLADVGYLCTLWVDRRRPAGRDVRAVGRHPRGGLPPARGARRPLRGALGALDDRHPLVPDAGAVEVDRLHGGQLQARDLRAPPTTPTSRASATASSSSPSARRRWPVATERSAVLLDWGGVMTTTCSAPSPPSAPRRASTATSWPTCSATTATPAALLIDFECGRIDEADFEPRLATALGLAWHDGLIDRLFGGAGLDQAMVDGVRAAARARRPHRPGLELLGHAPLPARPAGRALRRPRHLGRRGLPQARPAHVRARRRSASASPRRACVFVDDLAFNLDPARELGMAVVHHTSAATTLAELERLVG